jgi:glycosyltransferase involved in cell wall biosynthesis
MMRVAVDTGPLTSGHRVRGIGVHTSELLKQLERLDKKDKNFELVAFDFSNKKKLSRGEFDIVHYPYFHPFFISLPFTRKEKVVVTVHDLIPLIYPKAYPPGVKGRLKFLIQRYLVNRADRVITISETSKKDIVRFLGIPEDKVDVVYLAPKSVYKRVYDRNFLKKISKKYNLPSKFVLYVGDVNYNKNVISLINACKIIGMHLVIVGKGPADLSDDRSIIQNIKGPRDWLRFFFKMTHPEHAHYRKLIKKFKKNKKILRLGFVPDNELVAIFNLASVYCQPSYYEGFGVPVLEAMACGTPVVVSKTQALVEISGKAALFANPDDPKDIAKKIDKLIKDSELRKRMVERGLDNSSRFSWESTGLLTLQVYRKTIKQ